MAAGVATGDDGNGPGEGGKLRHGADETQLFTAGWLFAASNYSDCPQTGW